jgi:mRNA-degrading endonuclease RelE of RelBE toxin-antitoxin system
VEKKYNILFVDDVFDELEDIPSKTGNVILDKIELLERFPKIGLEVEKKLEGIPTGRERIPGTV